MNILEQIQSLVRQFRSELKAGKEPSIRSYLDRIDLSGRKNLFENLLLCELEYSRRKQKSANSDDYISRFPEFRSIIRQAFFESTMMSQDADGKTPDSADETMTVGQAPTRKIGQYRLVRELGRGGFGIVYEASHVDRGDRVALKTLPTMQDGHSLSSRDADRLHRFRREFRSLAEVNHPNLVGMQTLEVDGDRWFFTMDLIDGVDFLDYVRPNDQLDTESLQRVLPQLVRGIIALHQMGIVHRDLKPSNVLVNRDGHLVILDFGLVAELQHFAGETLSMGTKQFAGTPRYAAPEQVSGERTAAIDWYALGTMLFEAIAGRTPISGSGFEVVVKKQTEVPERLQEQDFLPEELASLALIVDEMLRRDPAGRPNDESIAERLNVRLDSARNDSGSKYTSSTGSRSDSSAGSDEPLSVDETGSQGGELLIGRERQLELLNQAFDVFSENRLPQAIFIRGRSGEGKTSLINFFVNSLRSKGSCLVLSGRCYDRESVPFKAVDCWIDPLVNYLRGRPQSNLVRWIPSDMSMLAKLFPVLRRIPQIDDMAVQPHDSIEMRHLRHRAFAALRDLLAAIGAETPVVLFVDDLQWGDGDSAKALRDVLQPPNAPAILLLGAYRSDEVADSPFLKEWTDYVAMNDHCIAQEILDVGPLSEAECMRLVAERFGTASESLQLRARKLFAGSLGNPYFIEQLLEAVDLDSDEIETVPISELIERRLQRLPPDARPLLETIAVASQSVILSEAAKIAGKNSSTMSIVTHMRNERLVRLIGSGLDAKVDTYHDKIRETVLADLPDDKRRSLHLRFAESILSDQHCATAENSSFYEREDAHPRLFDLAFHLLEAGDSRAFRYLLSAGEKALREYAIETSLDYLENAQRLLPQSADTDTRFRVLFGLAEAHQGIEQIKQARKYYELALPLAPSTRSEALCHYGLGSGLARQGDMKLAQVSFGRSLALLGEPIPETKIGLLLAITRTVFAFNFIKPALLRRWRGKKFDSDNDALAAQILNHSFYIYLTSIFLQVYVVIRGGIIGKRSRKKEAQATAYAQYSTIFAGGGLFWHVRPYLKRSERMCDSIQSKLDRAQIQHTIGAIYFCLGDLDLAEKHLNDSLPELQRAKHYLAGMSWHWLRHVASTRGDALRIQECANEELRYGQATNDLSTLSYAEYGLADAFARMGKYDDAIRLAKNSVRRLESADLITLAVAGQELGRALIQASQYHQAVEVLETNIKRIWSYWAFWELALDTFCLYAEAQLGTQWIPQTPNLNSSRLRAAGRSARHARWFCIRFPTLRPHAYRVSGRAALATGRIKKAIKYFDKAIRAAETLGARCELARSLVDKSWIGHASAAEDRTRGLRMLKELSCVLPEQEANQLRQD